MGDTNLHETTPITASCDRGPSEREYRALTSGAGFRLMDDRVVVSVRGDDRVSFIHGMCTNDIKKLRAGSILYALFLTEHAHVIADFHAWATEKELLIEADRALWTRAREHLEKLLVADDVEMEERDAILVIDIEGPASAAAIRDVAGGGGLGNSVAALEPWRFVSGADLMIARLPRIGLPAFTILADKAKVSDIVSRLRDATEVSAEAMDTIRIENGIARVGIDATEKTIALEARLESAISYSKGCYVGQETIERATARGGLKKRLFGLRIEGARPPEIGAPIHLDGKEVGHVSSATTSPRMGVLGLSILHHSAWTAGVAVEIKDRSGDLKAVVSDLPFK